MKFVIIENREINPEMVIEVGIDVKECINYREKATIGGTITEPRKTGQWFSSVFVLGTEPISIIRDSKKEVETEMQSIRRVLDRA